MHKKDDVKKQSMQVGALQKSEPKSEPQTEITIAGMDDDQNEIPVVIGDLIDEQEVPGGSFEVEVDAGQEEDKAAATAQYLAGQIVHATRRIRMTRSVR